MTHLSITEGVGPDSDKRETDWGEHVTDAEYRGGDSARATLLVEDPSSMDKFSPGKPCVRKS